MHDRPLRIRLIGGPRPLPGTVYDLAVSPRDRDDAEDGRFVRALCGTTVSPLASLRARCGDRRSAEHLAASWRVAVYRSIGHRRRSRPQPYRFEGAYSLEPVRDDHGRWTLVPCSKLPVAPAPAPDDGATSTWQDLEAALDAAAARFSTVAGLLPDGPLAERAAAARRTVGTCVADAARLCAVGQAIAPADTLDPAPTRCGSELAELAERVQELVAGIDRATGNLVRLHLDVGDADDPTDHAAALAGAWQEIQGTTGYR